MKTFRLQIMKKQKFRKILIKKWIPAYAGMTIILTCGFRTVSGAGKEYFRAEAWEGVFSTNKGSLWTEVGESGFWKMGVV